MCKVGFEEKHTGGSAHSFTSIIRILWQDCLPPPTSQTEAGPGSDDGDGEKDGEVVRMDEGDFRA